MLIRIDYSGKVNNRENGNVGVNSHKSIFNDLGALNKTKV
jgi:hypothetical protein